MFSFRRMVMLGWSDVSPVVGPTGSVQAGKAAICQVMGPRLPTLVRVNVACEWEGSPSGSWGNFQDVGDMDRRGACRTLKVWASSELRRMASKGGSS